MFKAINKVRMDDTDMAGILFFAKQFRFCHDALEDFMESLGLGFDKLVHQENFIFVVVHAEADYKQPLKVGDALEVFLTIEKIGQSSFTVAYQIQNREHVVVGTAKTVHVTLSNPERQKIAIPEKLKNLLKPYLKK